MKENDKRIAKNTLFLYFRLFITLIVGLYTSRVVLSTLGVSDYGIYNVIGGIVAMFAFINNAMVSSSQRFLSFELGTNKSGNAVFGTIFYVHLTIAIIVFLLAETFGIYILNNRLNIPQERLYAANWVLQGTIICFVISVLSVPYKSLLIAYERMSFFAYQSIIEVVLKLVIVYFLLVINHDKLIIYSMLLVSVSSVMLVIVYLYSYLKFVECRSKFCFDIEKFRDILKFSVWSLIGNLGFSSKDHMSNMLINIFCGTTINAARGLALQVSGIVSNFSNGFIIAINPQITQSYASGNIERSVSLVYMGTRLSFYLLSIISIPVIVNIEDLLSLWLQEVPRYTNVYVILTLVSCLIYSMSDAVTYAIQATGDIKKFQITICTVLFLELPIVYLMLKNHVSPAYVMVPTIIVNFLALVSRIIILKEKVNLYSVKYYMTNIVLKNIVIFIIALGISLFIKRQFNHGLLDIIIVSLCSLTISLAVFFSLGFTSQERKMVVSFIKHKVNHIQ